MDWGVNYVMPGSNGLRILVIFDKMQLAEILTWVSLVQLGTTGGAARLLGQIEQSAW